MSAKTVRFCDECGAERKEVNKWKSMVGMHGAPQFFSFEDANAIQESSRPRFDYCGQQCAMKTFARWLETGSILKTEVPQ